MFKRKESSRIDLIDQKSDWGLTVSEGSGKKSFFSKILLTGAYLFLMIASIIVLPVIVGVMLAPDSAGLILEAAVVAIVILVALLFKFQSGRNPRNAVQIDYKANQIRLGFQAPNGNFVRERVFGFRQIENVSVDQDDPSTPKLVIEVADSIVHLGFNQADEESLLELSRQILAARESAMRAPMRSRVQSTIAGVGASIRETTRRVSSRIVTP